MEANWQLIKQCKQVIINKGNQKGYLDIQSHVYRNGDKGLFKNAWKMKFNQDAYIGSYTVTKVKNIGVILAQHQSFQRMGMTSIMGQYVIDRCKS